MSPSNVSSMTDAACLIVVSKLCSTSGPRGVSVPGVAHTTRFGDATIVLLERMVAAGKVTVRVSGTQME